MWSHLKPTKPSHEGTGVRQGGVATWQEQAVRAAGPTAPAQAGVCPGGQWHGLKEAVPICCRNCASKGTSGSRNEDIVPCLWHQRGESLCFEVSEEFFCLLCCVGWCHLLHLQLDCTSVHSYTTFVPCAGEAQQTAGSI